MSGFSSGGCLYLRYKIFHKKTLKKNKEKSLDLNITKVRKVKKPPTPLSAVGKKFRV
jgi:hypothetical protein